MACDQQQRATSSEHHTTGTQSFAYQAARLPAAPCLTNYVLRSSLQARTLLQHLVALGLDLSPHSGLGSRRCVLRVADVPWRLFPQHLLRPLLPCMPLPPLPAVPHALLGLRWVFRPLLPRLPLLPLPPLPAAPRALLGLRWMQSGLGADASPRAATARFRLEHHLISRCEMLWLLMGKLHGRSDLVGTAWLGPCASLLQHLGRATAVACRGVVRRNAGAGDTVVSSHAGK